VSPSSSSSLLPVHTHGILLLLLIRYTLTDPSYHVSCRSNRRFFVKFNRHEADAFFFVNSFCYHSITRSDTRILRFHPAVSIVDIDTFHPSACSRSLHRFALKTSIVLHRSPINLRQRGTIHRSSASIRIDRHSSIGTHPPILL